MEKLVVNRLSEECQFTIGVPVADEQFGASDSISGVVRVWDWALVSLSETLFKKHNCFVLQMGRKDMDPV